MVQRKVWHALVALVLILTFFAQGTAVIAGTTGTLTGVLQDASTQAPLANVKVTVASPSQTATATTDASGRFTFLSLAPDTYLVSAEQSGYDTVTLQGVTIQADNNQTVTLSAQKSLQRIGRVTSRSASDLVKPGTTADVYSIDPTQQDKFQGLGGGGNANSAWSSMASIPGVFVTPNQNGYIGAAATISIRGGDYDQIGYEIDGVPVNRAFDNYPSGPLSSLGQQQVQVYTGAAPANAQAQGLSGYINQVIKTGTYPGFLQFDAAVSGPAPGQKFSLESGGATNNRNFSWYIGLGGFSQDARLVDQYNGASIGNTYGIALAPCIPGTPAASCYNNGVYNGNTPPVGAFPSNSMVLGPPNLFSTSTVFDRNSVVNLHFGFPRANGLKDDVQLLGVIDYLKTSFYDSTNDQGGATYLNAIGLGQPFYIDGYNFNAPLGKALPAGYQALTSQYPFPNSETGDILERIIAAPGRLITLVGNSGVGKSSLVQAGVIGSLKRQRWPSGGQPWPATLKDSRAFAYLAMKPGEDPIDALMSEFAALWFPDPTDPKRVDRRHEWAQRLRDGQARLADAIKATDEHFRDEHALTPPPRVFLYVDQGEELYARSGPANRKRFSEIIAEGLASSPERLIVMTSQRADYYGDLQANAALFNLTELINVPPLHTDNLALVLREPARVLGVGFENDDVISQVIKSAENQPGALPLLADLFTDLWERMRERGDGTLRISERPEFIQVGAALSRRADTFLSKYPDKVAAVKRLFTLRLAHVPRQGEAVRARWERKAKPVADPNVNTEWALAEVLAGPDWRLLVTGEKDGHATAEVAHEILLKTWPTLKRWLEDEREFLVWRGELDARRDEYDKAGEAGPRRQRQALLMGLPLDAAKKHLAARRGDIEPADQAFIEASARAERTVTRNRQRLQRAVGVLMLGIIVVLIGVIKQDYIKEQVNWIATVRPYQVANFDPYALKPEAEGAVKPKDAFRECAKDCPEMIVVPAGEFMMGWPATEMGYLNEKPQHKVTIPRPFAVSKFDVTFADWDACVEYGGCRGEDRAGDTGWGRGTRPVIYVNWHDAQAYVAWLSRMTGKTYRLLTEAEWEYAARAGTTMAYFWDEEVGKGNANCDGCGSEWDKKRTAPVGSFKPNAFGLYDMAGNVWQWVEDCYHKNYDGAPTDGSAWMAGDCKNRGVRGGAWVNNPSYMRSAHRNWVPTDDRSSYLGFRVARTIDP